jgi:hypothetical protein
MNEVMKQQQQQLVTYQSTKREQQHEISDTDPAMACIEQPITHDRESVQDVKSKKKKNES